MISHVFNVVDDTAPLPLVIDVCDGGEAGGEACSPGCGVLLVTVDQAHHIVCVSRITFTLAHFGFGGSGSVGRCDLPSDNIMGSCGVLRSGLADVLGTGRSSRILLLPLRHDIIENAQEALAQLDDIAEKLGASLLGRQSGVAVISV